MADNTNIAENVVNFKQNLDNKIKEKQEKNQKLAKIEENSMIITEIVFETLKSLNINITERIDLLKDVNLLMESITSLLLKIDGFDHNLQDFCEKYYDVDIEE